MTAEYPLLAWSQGRDAYRAGKGVKDVPYAEGPMREAWIKGWRTVKDAELPTARTAPRKAA